MYRYGFNGKEKDGDISEGAQDYGMRISDVRLGRFLSVDPLSSKFAYFTPYQFAGNTPIQAIDLDGEEPIGYSTSARFRHMGNEWLRQSNDIRVESQLAGKWFKMQIKDARGDQYTVYRQETTYINDLNYLSNHSEFYYLDISAKQSDGESNRVISGKDNHFMGNLKSFDAQERTDAKAGRESADMIAGTFAALIIAPFAYAGMVATGGGGLLTFSGNATWQISAAKFGIGFTADALSQQTANGFGSKWNVYSSIIAGTGTMFNMNTYTTAFVANIVQPSTDPKTNKTEFITPLNKDFNKTSYFLGSFLVGASGGGNNKMFGSVMPKKYSNLVSNFVGGGLNLSGNYAGNSFAGAITNEATAAPTPVNNSNNERVP